MYSPKIREDLVGELYLMAKANKIPMTKLVNQIIERWLFEMSQEPEDNYDELGIKEGLALSLQASKIELQGR